MLISLVYVLLYAASGVYIAQYLLPHQKPLRRLWLGLVIGLFLLSWLPSLFAFIMGFNLSSVLLGLRLAVGLGVFCCIKVKGRTGASQFKLNSLAPLAALIPILIVGISLFSTHIIRPEDGNLYVGQVTYGDLAMHLGFISSIATQGAFPPDYSIFPGHVINYPFLCETSSSALSVLGSSLRTAYLIPSLYAFVLVLLGVYLFFEQWLKRKERAIFATFLFFVGGGFGFAYFFDLANANSTALSSLIGSSSSNNLPLLLDGFYQTPTNLPTIGLRWVNPIVDMLVPQRATLFGWAFLFPCLYLLHGWMFENERKNVLLLAVLAGGLPLIHTHSFLGLGIVSAVYCLYDLIAHFNVKRLKGWLLYGGIALLLAAPQLVCFTFAQASESGMVRVHFNWANEIDSFLWFYIKNLGWIFLLLPFGLCLLSKRDRQIMTAPLLLWLIAELVVFQPNIYDNNKLLFIWFAYSCGLAAKLLGVLKHRASVWLEKHSNGEADNRAAAIVNLLCCSAVAFYLLVKIIRAGASAAIDLEFGSCCTLMLIMGFVAWQSGAMLCRDRSQERKKSVASGVCLGLSSIFVLLQAVSMYKGYAQPYLSLTVGRGVLLLLLALGTLALTLSFVITQKARIKSKPLSKAFNTRYSRVALHLVSYTLAFTLFISGVLTIVRELRSNYMVFSASDVEAAEYIKASAQPDALFLTDSNWHLNAVSVLTGRNIVCGTDTFLYYHGIDTAKRKADIALMFSDPAACEQLFTEYGVDYVYIGNSERNNYAIDEAWFEAELPKVFDNGAIKIYSYGE